MARVIVKRFGESAPKRYLFPTYQEAFSTNFSNLVTRVTRLPGVDGGFDEDGRDPAASEIGNVNLNFRLIPGTDDEMEALLDNVKAMADWGLQRLVYQPTDENLPERWCMAKVSSIQIPRVPSGNSDLWQNIQMTFSVATPFWFTQGTASVEYDGPGVLYDTSGINYDGSATGRVMSSATEEFTESIAGNANTFPRFLLETISSVSSVTIQRIVSGIVVDELVYDAPMTGSDVLEIDCEAMSVTFNGADAYGADFSFLRAEWFELEPGDNLIRVMAAGSRIYTYYSEVYR